MEQIGHVLSIIISFVLYERLQRTVRKWPAEIWGAWTLLLSTLAFTLTLIINLFVSLQIIGCYKVPAINLLVYVAAASTSIIIINFVRLKRRYK